MLKIKNLQKSFKINLCWLLWFKILEDKLVKIYFYEYFLQ